MASGIAPPAPSTLVAMPTLPENPPIRPVLVPGIAMPTAAPSGSFPPPTDAPPPPVSSDGGAGKSPRFAPGEGICSGCVEFRAA